MVGVLWSAVAKVLSGYSTGIPRFLSPKKATGLVTSCTMCRSINSTSGPPSILRTTCESHTLSDNVFFIVTSFYLPFLRFRRFVRATQRIPLKTTCKFTKIRGFLLVVVCFNYDVQH